MPSYHCYGNFAVKEYDEQKEKIAERLSNISTVQHIYIFDKLSSIGRKPALVLIFGVR